MYDLEDTSWKVRRSAIQVTHTLILTHPELLRVLTETLFDKLIKRFYEKEQNVKQDVFSTLSDFLKMIVYSEGARDSDGDHDELIERPMPTRIKPSFLDFYSKISSMVASLVKVSND